MEAFIGSWIQSYSNYKQLQKQLEAQRDAIINYMKQNNTSTLLFVDKNNNKNEILLQKIRTTYIDPTKLSKDAYQKSASIRIHERLSLLSN